MSDNDLERQLRSQHGPREEGYTPTRLPMRLEEARASRSAPSPFVRGGLFVGAVAAGALAVAVVGAALSSGLDRGVGGKNDASPTAAPSASASPATHDACTPDDFVFSAEPWGGAAGSRGTVVTISLAAGHDLCGLGPDPYARITDADGSVLVKDEGPRDLPLLFLHPGDTLSYSVRWSNWCAAAPASPVTLSLEFMGWADYVPITVPGGGDDPVPPCSGGSASTLSVSSL
jgi:hypothetical protein